MLGDEGIPKGEESKIKDTTPGRQTLRLRLGNENLGRRSDLDVRSGWSLLRHDM